MMAFTYAPDGPTADRLPALFAATQDLAGKQYHHEHDTRQGHFRANHFAIYLMMAFTYAPDGPTADRL
ncbi:MAG TPA: hypothetical protein PLB89_18005, partial [Flavobacteriales bacterium]|nr:hypothetical protein [Flavobacteriales bacterium]